MTTVKNFVVRTIWNNGEVRDIDFKPIIEEWKQSGADLFSPLYDAKIFRNISVSDDHTLCWPEVKLKTTFKGITIEAALDIDPDVMYEKSKLIETYERPHIGILFKTARELAGLSQLQVAKNSGTSRNYISKIESDRSDIQVDTLFKLVKLGMGKELKVSIE